MLSKLFHILKSSPNVYDDKESTFWIDFIFQHCLNRCADTMAMKFYKQKLMDGAKLSEIFFEIRNSEESKRRTKFELNLNDGEFIISLAEILFPNGGALPNDITHYKKILQGSADEKARVLIQLFENYVQSRSNESNYYVDQQKIWIMGTNDFITYRDWSSAMKQKNIQSDLSASETLELLPVEVDICEVSIITSLYKGGRYIRKFLDTIVNQTYFSKCELIIIDANSPDGEEILIKEYMKKYKNIKYKRVGYKIGIYDAWNVGVELSSGQFLTNANVDDIRSKHSIETQVKYLKYLSYADVVYQDFYYTLDFDLLFSQIENIGYVSDLPLITKNILLNYNPLHNAPMWRKSLHEDVGYFDTSFQSAGDWEFWLRCLDKGKIMLKTPGYHVVYYHNPDGVSTRANTVGHHERKRILGIYSRKLISEYLRMDPPEFLNFIGSDHNYSQDISYSDYVKQKLINL